MSFDHRRPQTTAPCTVRQMSMSQGHAHTCTDAQKGHAAGIYRVQDQEKHRSRAPLTAVPCLIRIAICSVRPRSLPSSLVPRLLFSHEPRRREKISREVRTQNRRQLTALPPPNSPQTHSDTPYVTYHNQATQHVPSSTFRQPSIRCPLLSHDASSKLPPPAHPHLSASAMHTHQRIEFQWVILGP